MNARIAVTALALVIPGAARAQLTTETAATPSEPACQLGIGLGLGGGVNNFVASEMTNATDVSPAWEVRAVAGTRLPIALEVAYVGTRRVANVAGVSGAAAGETPHIFSHGIEGAARVQYPYLTGRWLVEPFAFGGFGWTHYGVDASVAPTSTVRTTGDDVLVVPFGAGVTAAFEHFMVEGRFTYRATFNQDLIAKPDGTIANMSNWQAGATIGYEF